MAQPSPVHSAHIEAEALFGAYGPPGSPVQLVQAFDPVEIEYAAIRRHAAIFDAPHRATLVVTGPDRVSFLNRMLTQDLKDLAPGRSASAFLLNRKGRIDADFRIAALGDRIILEVDVFAAERAAGELERYIITEDCRIENAASRFHTFWMHGPASVSIVARAASDADLAAMAPRTVRGCTIAGAPVIVSRNDLARGGGEGGGGEGDGTGTIGLSLLVEAADAPRVYDAISTPWSARERPGAIAPTTAAARRIGWHALNIARIEAGTALYMLDFGPDSLPHECGDAVLADRVSFRKGCYLGQEIVARMQSLGRPKQKLVELRLDGGPADADQAQTGTPLVEADIPGASVVGAITSSCISPLLGQTPIALAMVKSSHALPGRELWAQLSGSRLRAVVRGRDGG